MVDGNAGGSRNRDEVVYRWARRAVDPIRDGGLTDANRDGEFGLRNLRISEVRLELLHASDYR